MKKTGFYFVVALIFSGCFNLKTPLPEVSYYDLDVAPKSQKKCQSSFYIGIAEIRSLALVSWRYIRLMISTLLLCVEMPHL